MRKERLASVVLEKEHIDCLRHVGPQCVPWNPIPGDLVCFPQNMRKHKTFGVVVSVRGDAAVVVWSVCPDAGQRMWAQMVSHIKSHVEAADVIVSRAFSTDDEAINTEAVNQ